MRFQNSSWQLVFLILTGLQALAVVGTELQIFISSHVFYHGDPDRSYFMSDLTTYFTVLMFGIMYQLAITWHAFRSESIIQVIALVAYNFAMLLYVMIQKSQLCWVRDCKAEKNDPLWLQTRATSTVLEWTVASVTLVMAFAAWRLFQERSWKRKQLGSELGMVKKYHTYQVYMALIKIDIFMCLAFNGQIIMKQALGREGLNKTLKMEIVLTFVSLINLLFGAFFIRKEKLWGSNIVLFILFIQLVWSLYLIGNLAHRFNDGEHALNKTQKRLMNSWMIIIIIGVNTVILIVATMAVSIACMLNFGKGLRQHIATKPLRPLLKDRWISLTSGMGGHMIRERNWDIPIASSGESSSYANDRTWTVS